MEPKAERTRRYIIEKSASLFNRKGYHGTSMSDIMEATGLAKGGVYGHFKSKDDIVTEAFDYAFFRVLDALAIRIKSRDVAIDKLDAILDFYREFLDRPPVEGGCPIQSYSGHNLDEVPAIGKLIARGITIMIDALVRILDKGKKYGQIKPEIDSQAYAEIIYSRIQGALTLGKATEASQRLNRLLDALQRDLRRDLPI
jgi:TetR/AcrR family transcriptional regulator, transcriptional repressor for nem operon